MQEDCREIINEDGTFTIRSNGEDQTIVAADYKVFISLNTDPKHRGLKRLVPEKYRDVREDEFENRPLYESGTTGKRYYVEDDQRINRYSD